MNVHTLFYEGSGVDTVPSLHPALAYEGLSLLVLHVYIHLDNYTQNYIGYTFIITF